MKIKKGIAQEGFVKWESPSNIALVKYWGKYGRQYPTNPSISFTLSNAKTSTSCKYTIKENSQDPIISNFKFEGKENLAFENRIQKFLTSVIDYFPVLNQLSLELESENTFPHSSGIASSASAMSALALCICDIEKSIVEDYKENFTQRASILARLGSGSASRSVIEKLAIWGKNDFVAHADNDYAIAFGDNVHTDFHKYHDDILIVSKNEKSVSSSAGHKLMDGNPYAEARYQDANKNLGLILNAMKSGDHDAFIHIVEREAMSLHALMMCSDPSYILMEPNTIEVINRVRSFRRETNIPVCFTLDAGPNVHLLYPDDYTDKLTPFISEQLMPLTQNHNIIRDHVGNGPTKLD